MSLASAMKGLSGFSMKRAAIGFSSPVALGTGLGAMIGGIKGATSDRTENQYTRLGAFAQGAMLGGMAGAGIGAGIGTYAAPMAGHKAYAMGSQAHKAAKAAGLQGKAYDDAIKSGMSEPLASYNLGAKMAKTSDQIRRLGPLMKNPYGAAPPISPGKSPLGPSSATASNTLATATGAWWLAAPAAGAVVATAAYSGGGHPVNAVRNLGRSPGGGYETAQSQMELYGQQMQMRNNPYSVGFRDTDEAYSMRSGSALPTTSGHVRSSRKKNRIRPGQYGDAGDLVFAYHTMRHG